jgi:hypothetical protein
MKEIGVWALAVIGVWDVTDVEDEICCDAEHFSDLNFRYKLHSTQLIHERKHCNIKIIWNLNLTFII